ncbi:MAG: BatA domain-containing protein [Bacteroidetes bacterium]|nr:BatA domain-containing protein [Bacteroidota bacterium]
MQLGNMVWLYPLFLWALLALLIPIIIHLFNFRRYKKIAFTNVRFLKQINQQTKSGNQLKKYLILGSRLLALTFLVFAFAQPVITNKNNQLNAKKQLVSIVLDNSYSMNNIGEEGPLLEASKNRARAIINASANNNEFNIITANVDESLLHNTNKQTALENLDKIKISAGSKSFSQLLSVQQRLLAKSELIKSSYIISDFQKNNPITITQSDRSVKQTLVKINAENAENISIDTCYFSSPILQVGQPIGIEVWVSNKTSKDIEGLTLDLKIDNKPKGIASYNIKAFGKEKQVINFVLEVGGNHQCVLQLPGDNMAFDDQLYFSINLKNNFKVLNISDDDRYIQAIFNAQKGFTYVPMKSGNIQFSEFQNASLICLQGASTLSTGAVTELNKYAKDGGNVFVFPNANLPFGGLQNLASVFGFQIAENETPFLSKVSSFDREHPIFNQVFEKIPKNPDLPSVSNYFPINSPAGITIFKLPNGNSYLQDITAGKGHLFICASALTNEFTNFQNHALFVPILLKAAMLNNFKNEIYYQCGQTDGIETDLKYQKENNIQFKMGKFNYSPEVINTNGNITLNTNGEIETAGNYTLSSSASDSTLSAISFNYNRNESDCRTFNETEMQKKADEMGAELFTKSAEKLASEISVAQKGSPMWKWCIILVLLFLLIEILLIRFLNPNAKIAA